MNAELGQRREEIAGLSDAESFAHGLKRPKHFGGESVQVIHILLMIWDSMADFSCCPGLGQSSQDGSQVDVIHAGLRSGAHCQYMSIEVPQCFVKILTSAVTHQQKGLVFDVVPCPFKLFQMSFILTMLHLQIQSGLQK